MAKNTKQTKTAPSKASTPAPKTEPGVDTETVDAVKEAFRTKHDRDIELSDKTIQMTIDGDKAWDEKDDDGKLALLELAETTFKKVSVADPGITVLVKKMTNDTSFMTEIDEILVAARKTKQSAVSMLAQLWRIFTQSEMDGMPMPGYDETHAEGTPYKADKRSIRTGTGDPITTVWTNDLVSSMPQGKRAEDDLADLAKEKAAPGSIARFKGKHKDELNAVASAAQADRNTLRSLVKRSIKLHHRWMAIKKLNSVGIRWIKGDKEKGIAMPTKLGLGELTAHVEMVSGSPKPIWIYDASDPSKGRDFSVTQVNAFQPEKAVPVGDETMMAALVATAGKGSDDESGTDTEGTGEDDTPEQSLSFAQRVVSFFGKVENKAAITKAMANYKKDPTGADWMDLIQELDKAIHPLAEKTRNLHKQRQDAMLLNADNEAEEAEAAA